MESKKNGRGHHAITGLYGRVAGIHVPDFWRRARIGAGVVSQAQRFAGVGLITAGIAMYSLPLALITVGILLVIDAIT